MNYGMKKKKTSIDYNRHDELFFIIIILLASFLRQIVFHWNLSDCKFLHVSRTLLGIPADLNNGVV